MSKLVSTIISAVTSVFFDACANNLSSESIEKLSLVRPQTLAQAMRIDGVRQSDIASLTFYLYKRG